MNCNENLCQFASNLHKDFNFHVVSDCGFIKIQIDSDVGSVSVHENVDGIVINFNKVLDLHISRPHSEENKKRVKEVLQQIYNALI